jgi:hypothetical protein
MNMVRNRSTVDCRTYEQYIWMRVSGDFGMIIARKESTSDARLFYPGQRIIEDRRVGYRQEGLWTRFVAVVASQR